MHGSSLSRSCLRVVANTLFGIAIVTITGFGSTACVAGPVPVPEDDLAVFRAVLKPDCQRSEQKISIVSDSPPAATNHHIPSAWSLSSSLSDELTARARVAGRWPHVDICAAVQIVDGSRVEAIFRQDKRIPPGWDEFHAAFPSAVGLKRVSLPAFTADRSRAVVYVEWTCGSLCGSGIYIEFVRDKDGWKVSQQEAAWIS
jgi:hypothetical protein